MWIYVNSTNINSCYNNSNSIIVVLFIEKVFCKHEWVESDFVKKPEKNY